MTSEQSVVEITSSAVTKGRKLTEEEKNKRLEAFRAKELLLQPYMDVALVDIANSMGIPVEAAMVCLQMHEFSAKVRRRASELFDVDNPSKATQATSSKRSKSTMFMDQIRRAMGFAKANKIAPNVLEDLVVQAIKMEPIMPHSRKPVVA